MLSSFRIGIDGLSLYKLVTLGVVGLLGTVVVVLGAVVVVVDVGTVNGT